MERDRGKTMKRRLLVLLFLFGTVISITASAAEVNESTLVKNDPDLLMLVNRFYDAIDRQDDFYLSLLVSPWSDEEKDIILNDASYPGRKNVEIFSKQVSDDAYVILVKFEKEENGTDETGLSWMFVFTDMYGIPYIASHSYQDMDAQSYVEAFAEGEDVKALIAEWSGNNASEEPETETEPEPEEPEAETEDEKPKTDYVMEELFFPGVFRFEGHTYRVGKVPADVDQATAYCEAFEGGLAVISSQRENIMLLGELAKYSVTDQWLIEACEPDAEVEASDIWVIAGDEKNGTGPEDQQQYYFVCEWEGEG